MDSLNPAIARQLPPNSSGISLHTTKLSQKNLNLSNLAASALTNIQRASTKNLECAAKEIKLNKTNLLQDEGRSTDDEPMLEMDFMSDAISDVTLSLEQLVDDAKMFDFDFTSDATSVMDEGIDDQQSNEGMEIIENLFSKDLQLDEKNLLQAIEKKTEELSASQAKKIESISEMQSDKIILNSILSDKAATIANAKHFQFVDGKFKMSSIRDLSADDITRVVNDNKLAFVVNDTVFLHPDCGFAKGHILEVEDDDGNIKQVRVDFFAPEEIQKIKEAFTGYIQALIAERNREGKKDVKEDENLISLNALIARLAPQVFPKPKAKAAEKSVRTNGYTTAALNKRQEEESAIQNAQKKKDNIAFERKKSVENKEIKKESIKYDESVKVATNEDSTTTMQAPTKNHEHDRKPSVFREKTTTKSVFKTRES